MQEKFYLTTAIAYVNAPPHLGHALEFIESDAIVRYKSLRGFDTYFLTGTDEHGVKIYNAAKAAGLETKAMVDKNAQTFKDLKDLLSLSYDDFIQTSDQKRHWPACQKLWKVLTEKGDIYQKEYEGLYCEGCELFMKETDMVDGKCPTHKKAPVPSKETNYFFRLSKYSEKIGQLIESDTLRIVPESRKHEFLNMVKEGLTDVSFSRPREVLPWGVPVPGDDNQVMYVWCDALTNYISAIGYTEDSDQFKKLWPADMHVIGKDIVRFHAGIWIGMLLSAELPLPKSIFVHGFLTHNGEKMSKTLGNVVDPVEMVERYGVEALRYYLLREIPVGRDGDFSDELFLERYNSDLANNLGNLVNRVHTLVSRNDIKEFKFDACAPDYKAETEKTYAAYLAAMDDFDLYNGIHTLWKLVNFGNKKMEDEKPWASIKGEEGSAEREKGEGTLCGLLEVLRHVSVMLQPFLPATSANIRTQLGLGELADFEEERKWGSLKGWNKLGEAKIMFPRVEAKVEAK